MKSSRYRCDPDTVIGMQEMGVGVEEILQYCHGLLSLGEVRKLIGGLESVISDLEAGTDLEKKWAPSLSAAFQGSSQGLGKDLGNDLVSPLEELSS